MTIPDGLRPTPFAARYPAGIEVWIDVYGHAVPLWLTDPGEEYDAIRNGAALLEYSMLYKWYVEGAGAVETVDAVFSRDVTTQTPGRIAYGAVTDATGMMVDDVTVSVAGPDKVLVVGGNTRTLQMLIDAAPEGTSVIERRDDLAVLSLQGPRSREILQSITDDDVSNEAFPYYTLRSGMVVAGIPADVNRVGFTAELGYEIVVPRSSALALWDAVTTAAEKLAIDNVRGIGAAALMMARIEAGMIMGELEYDQTVTPYECRMGWAVDLDKGSWAGRDALQGAQTRAEGRVVTVRIDTDPDSADGAVLLRDGAEVGHVTMAVPSPQLGGATIGMARIQRTAAAVGTSLVLRTDGGDYAVEVLRTPVYDPDRLRVRS